MHADNSLTAYEEHLHNAEYYNLKAGRIYKALSLLNDLRQDELIDHAICDPVRVRLNELWHEYFNAAKAHTESATQLEVYNVPAAV